MEELQLREQEVQIARYQFLSREVTDPLAVCLLRVIVRTSSRAARDRDIGQSCSECGSHP